MLGHTIPFDTLFWGLHEKEKKMVRCLPYSHLLPISFWKVQKSDDALSLDLVCHQPVDPPMGFVLEGLKKEPFNKWNLIF